MADRRSWQLIYGGAFAVLLAISVLAVATHPRAFWQEAISTARSLVDMADNRPDRSVEAVPAVLGLFAGFFATGTRTARCRTSQAIARILAQFQGDAPGVLHHSLGG